MKAILVDDEYWGLQQFKIECEQLHDIDVIGSFDNAGDALKLAEKQRIDVAFLDIEMPEMDGMELADSLRAFYSDIVIVFVSGHEQYYREAMKEREADYFLLKPYTVEEVQKVLERARLLGARQKKRVRIHTFGNFEIFVDGSPLKITSPKAKELLAILVDAAGESVTVEDAFTKMWETLPYNHTEAGRYRQALQKLQATLKSADISDILLSFPHAKAIRKDMVECDYFDMLAEKPNTIKEWKGDYMNQYTWAEEHKGTLIKIKRKYDPDAEMVLYE